MAEPSRGVNVAAWVASALLAALFVVAAGYPKVTGAEQAVKAFRDFGYSDGFRVFIGACEIAGGIGLLIPRLAMWAGCGLIFIMLGALYSVLTHGGSAQAPLPLVVGLLCAFIAWARRSRALLLS